MAEGGPKKKQAPDPPSGKSKIDALLARASGALSVGSEVADVLVHLSGGLTVPGLTAVGLKAIDQFRKARAVDSSDYFGQDCWERLHVWGFDARLYEALAFKAPIEKIGAVTGQDAHYMRMDGLGFGWIKESDHGAHGPWLPAGQDKDASLRILGRCLWEHAGSTRVRLVAGSRRGRWNRDRVGGFRIEPDDDHEVFESQVARNLLERLQKRRAKGQHISCFIIGDPGVGKSCMMRWVAHELGGFQLRIPTKTLPALDDGTLEGAVKLLAPQTVLMDDIDRSHRRDDLDQFLSELEVINRQVPVYMVSANFSRHIDGAVLRPGRFDELEVVEGLEVEILDKIAGDVPPRIQARLRKMPVAYVVEFAERRDAYGIETAMAELSDLENRCERAANLNRRAVRRTKRLGTAKKKRRTAKQRAAAYRRDAAKLDRQAAQMAVRAENMRARAVDMDEKAVEDAAKAKKKEAAKQKSTKKKAAKNAPKKKAAKNVSRKRAW